MLTFFFFCINLLQSPRRNCCRVLSSPGVEEDGNKTMTIDVGVCEDWEVNQL